MARPKAKELTDRELEVMRAFWDQGPATAEEIRKRLGRSGTKLAYVTVANVVRQLDEKGFLEQTNEQRPFVYAATRSFDEVSTRLVGNLISKVFDGSRQRMLVQMLEKRKLTAAERSYLENLLAQQEDGR